VDHGPEVNWRTVPWRSILIFIAIGVWALTPILIVTALAFVGLTYLERRCVTAGR